MAVAFIVGTVELLTIASTRLGLHGGFWSWTSGVNLNTAGYLIIGLFVFTWLGSVGAWRLWFCKRVLAVGEPAAAAPQPLRAGGGEGLVVEEGGCAVIAALR